MLALRSLEFAWAPGSVLRFTDFELAQGGQALLVGASGSGKSTLLALIAGLLTPSAGRVVVAGTDMASLPRGARDTLARCWAREAASGSAPGACSRTGA